MGRIITVASGKGGTGKTTSVAAISSCLAILGYKTLCIDFDTGMGNLDLALAMADYAIMDYSDVLAGRIDVSEAYIQSPHISNLYFLSAPTSVEFEESDRSGIIQMLTGLQNSFDYCVIDSPPGIGTGFLLAHSCSDMSVIVTTSELPAMRDATRAAGVLRDTGTENIRLLVNKVNRKNLKQIRTTIDDIIDTTGVQLIGIIPEDKNVFLALHEGIPLALYPKRISAYDFLDVTRRITGEDIPLKY